MHVYGISQVHGTQGLQGPHRAAAPQNAPSSGAGEVDQLDISAEARQAAQARAGGEIARDGGEIRHDRVAAIREAIANGTYETEDKLNAALDRLLDEIG